MKLILGVMLVVLLVKNANADEGRIIVDEVLPYQVSIQNSRDFDSECQDYTYAKISWIFKQFLKKDEDYATADHLHACGGTIISRKYILSAAYYFDNYRIPERFKYVSVISGVTDLNEADDYHRFCVNDITIHKDYNNKRFENNLAILKLTRGIDKKYGAPIHTIGPWHKSPGEIGFIAGWDWEMDKIDDKLRALYIQIMDAKNCTNVIDASIYTSNNNIFMCGDPVVDGSFISRGDCGSGVISRDGKEIFGVVSHFWAIGLPDGSIIKMDMLHTRISLYFDWIHKNSEDEV